MGLSTTAEKVKKALIWMGFGLVGLVVIWILWIFLSFFWHIFFPPPPVGPNFAFGQISKPFNYNLSPKNTIFELDIPGGQIPKVTDILPVYAIPAPETNFTSLDNGKKVAAGAGLDSEPIKLSEFEWRWGSKKQPNKSMQLNIATNNFNYKYDWANENSALSGLFKTTDNKMISKAKSYLATFRSNKTDLKTGSGRASYFKLVGKESN
ncbi:MAG: hypothetical protein Q7T50_02855, partial [Candidatus Magasanikbacteria bacterium]|nr:hypothetical protein [Candidatus Magasanikbacteria bacterium]